MQIKYKCEQCRVQYVFIKYYNKNLYILQTLDLIKFNQIFLLYK